MEERKALSTNDARTTGLSYGLKYTSTLTSHHIEKLTRNESDIKIWVNTTKLEENTRFSCVLDIESGRDFLNRT